MSNNRSKFKYTLLVGSDAYFADTIVGLLCEIFKHRLEHLRGNGTWMN